MELRRGQVVKSRAGRDQGGYLAVLEVDPPWAVLADGKGRPLERPKRKKPMHLAPTTRILPEEALATNRKLRAALRELRREAGEERLGEKAERLPSYDAEV